MDSQHFENSTLSAPDHSSRCTSSTNIDPGPDGSTKLGDTVAGTDSGSQECVLEQPDPGRSDMLHTTKTEYVRSLDGKYHCNLCHMRFIRVSTLRSHLRKHSDERPFECTICGRAFSRQNDHKCHENPAPKSILRNPHDKSSEHPDDVREGVAPHRDMPKKAVPANARWTKINRKLVSPESLRQDGIRFNEYVDHVIVLKVMDLEEIEKYTRKTAEIREKRQLSMAIEPPHDFMHDSEMELVCRLEPSAQDLALISARQNEIFRSSSGGSKDSGYESALDLDPSESLSISSVHVEVQTEGPQKTLPYYDSLSSLGSHFMPSPPLQSLQDPTDILTLLPDRPETSEDADNSLSKTVRSGDELDCEGFSRAIELSDHQTESQESSDSEGRSCYKVRHVSKETTFAQESPWEKDGSGRFPYNPEGSLSSDESSSNSGFETGYNDTSEGSILSYSQRALISRLMDEICSSFFYQISHRPRQRGQGGQGSRESSSSSTEQTITTNRLIGEPPGTRRKRSDKEGEDPEDEDDGKYKRPRNQNSDDGHSTKERYFACPFHKFDASTYGSGNVDPRVGLKYRSCGPPGWPNIGKLK